MQGEQASLSEASRQHVTEYVTKILYSVLQAPALDEPPNMLMVTQQKDCQDQDNHQGSFYTRTAASKESQVAIEKGVSIMQPPSLLTRSDPHPRIGPIHHGSLEHPLIERPLNETLTSMSLPANDDNGHQCDTQLVSASFPDLTPSPSLNNILPPPSPLTTSGPTNTGDHMECLGPAIIGKPTVDVGGHLIERQAIETNEVSYLTSQINDKEGD